MIWKKKKRKKWIFYIIIALVALILAVMPMIASKNQEDDDLASVKSAEAEVRDVDTVLIGGGQLESKGVYSVTIPEYVKIKEFLVGNGDIVAKGDAIAEVDKVSVLKAISDVQDAMDELEYEMNEADSSSTTSYINASPSGTVKKLYAQEGDSVAQVMLDHGALAIISLDDVMAVDVPAGMPLAAGDAVTVTINGTDIKAKVKKNISGTITVTFDDNKYDIGSTVTVSTTGGDYVGTGALYVYNAWNVTGYYGTVHSVYISEEESISAGQYLFAITENGKSAAYQKAADKRQKYESMLQELFVMYKSGVVSSPCDGIVSGIDTTGTFMLSADAENSGAKLDLLVNRTYTDDNYQLMMLANSDANSVIPMLSSPEATVNCDYSGTLTAMGAKPAEGAKVEWSASPLPDGLTLDSTTGVISGKPTKTGTTKIHVEYIIDGTVAGSNDISFKVDAARIQIITASLGQGVVGQSYSAELQASDATSILEGDWSAIPSKDLPDGLPEGLKLSNTEDSSNCKIIGTPTKAGTYSITIQFEYNDGETITRTYNLIIMSSSGGSGGNTQSSSGGNNVIIIEDDGLYSRDTLTIATVTSQEQMVLNVSIDELDISKVYVGQPAEITMSAIAADDVEAVVDSISNEGENSGGNSKFTVELELQKSSDMLPGMNATAKIVLDTTKDAVCVPAAAIYEVNGESVVYTSYNAKKNTLGDPVVVTVGTSDSDYTQILSGISAGQTVYYEIYEVTGSGNAVST